MTTLQINSIIFHVHMLDQGCLSIMDNIVTIVQKYAVCSEDLNEIGHHLHECDEDAFDTKALTLIWSR